MNANELAKKIGENSKCKNCGDDMLPSLTPIPGHNFATFKEFNTRGLGFICDSCGNRFFISEKELNNESEV